MVPKSLRPVKKTIGAIFVNEQIMKKGQNFSTFVKILKSLNEIYLHFSHFSNNFVSHSALYDLFAVKRLRT